MTSTEQYTAVASQLRSATEQSTKLWKQSAEAFTQHADAFSKLPSIDPASGVQRYFELVQRAVDVNRDLAAMWAAATTSISDVLGNQVATAGEIARKQIDVVAELVTDQVGAVEQVLLEQADKIE
jgi:hypothetical protein